MEKQINVSHGIRTVCSDEIPVSPPLTRSDLPAEYSLSGSVNGAVASVFFFFFFFMEVVLPLVVSEPVRQ